jgi:hypothetical protein
MQTITVGGKTFTLVSMPAYPGFSDIALSLVDSVAVVQSPYIPSQSQTQQWPGSDAWVAQIALPPMDRNTTGAWRAWLGECHGAANVFQLGDQSAPRVRDFAHPTLTRSIPLVDGAVGNNLVSSYVLFTKGWNPTTFRLMLPGDYLQIGYRLYMVAGQAAINSDSTGKAQIPVYPSLREVPPDGTPLILFNPVGLFRLASNKRDWHTAVTRFTTLSFKCVEAR